jgi:hypothetical protein
MKTHIELPEVNEYFCRSIPYGTQAHISYEQFLATVNKGSISGRLSSRPSSNVIVPYCITCLRLAKARCYSS